MKPHRNSAAVKRRSDNEAIHMPKSYMNRLFVFGVKLLGMVWMVGA